MYILGINGGVRAGYQDVSAVLIKDGEVVYAIAEERLNRKKHSAGQLPFLSIKAALDFAHISMKDIAYVATHGSTWGEAYEKVVEEYLNYAFGYSPQVMRIHHHLAHAASAYYGSGYDEAMVLSIDASGDGISLQKAIGRAGKIEVVEQEERTNSLGIFYSIMTQFCGFTRDTDEYKLMGLAPYGDASKIDLSDVLNVEESQFTLNNAFIKEIKTGAPQGSRQQAAFSKRLVSLLGKPRIAIEPISQYYKDVAAAAQDRLSEAILVTIKQFYKQTGIRKVCLAGGVALNCEVNRHIQNLDFVDELFVQPASGDDGISLGAAWYVSNQMGYKPKPTPNYYLGTAFSNDQIQKQLVLMNLTYQKVDNVAEIAANLVAENKVVAWFQGRDEFGPRSLGARSILANPKAKEMKQTLNHKIKFREGFRPFCPSVLEEDFAKHFTGKQQQSPYMAINYKVKEPALNPAISHVNETARIQTVSKSDNPLCHEYLCQLKKKIGIGMSINTSFNRNQEPMVHSPKDAVSAYYGSGIDALIIGNFLLEK